MLRHHPRDNCHHTRTSLSSKRLDQCTSFRSSSSLDSQLSDLIGTSFFPFTKAIVSDWQNGVEGSAPAAEGYLPQSANVLARYQGLNSDRDWGKWHLGFPYHGQRMRPDFSYVHSLILLSESSLSLLSVGLRYMLSLDVLLRLR